MFRSGFCEVWVQLGFYKGFVWVRYGVLNGTFQVLCRAYAKIFKIWLKQAERNQQVGL